MLMHVVMTMPIVSDQPLPVLGDYCTIKVSKGMFKLLLR